MAKLQSIPGIALAAVSLAVMPFLSGAGRELDSASAVADSKQTLLCTYLSAMSIWGKVKAPSSHYRRSARNPQASGFRWTMSR